MTDNTLLPFDLLAVCRKKVTAAFEGGLITGLTAARLLISRRMVLVTRRS